MLSRQVQLETDFSFPTVCPTREKSTGVQKLKDVFSRNAVDQSFVEPRRRLRIGTVQGNFTCEKLRKKKSHAKVTHLLFVSPGPPWHPECPRPKKNWPNGHSSKFGQGPTDVSKKFVPN